MIGLGTSGDWRLLGGTFYNLFDNPNQIRPYSWFDHVPYYTVSVDDAMLLVPRDKLAMPVTITFKLYDPKDKVPGTELSGVSLEAWQYGRVTGNGVGPAFLLSLLALKCRYIMEGQK